MIREARRTGALRVDREFPSLQVLTTKALREAIVNGHFRPGQRVTERELCEQTGVSRTIVREALGVLENEGLIDRRRNEGIFVATVTADEARQIYEIRAALESSLAALFVDRASDFEIADLESALQDLRVASADGDPAEYNKALDTFYQVLIKGSGNEVALRLLESLRARMAYLRTVTLKKADAHRKRQTLDLLSGIVDAAKARDTQGVSERCRAFVERSARFALEVLEQA